jgi:predicted aspartyl protease
MKKIIARSVLAVCLNLFLFTFNLTAQTPNADSCVRFRLLRDYLIVVSVQTGDAGTFDFLLDTGTNSTIITPDLAARLKLRPSDSTEMITPTGSQITPRAWLSHVALGSKSASNVEVLVAELRELRQLDSRIQGILGQNFLAQFNFILDYRKRRIDFAGANDGQPGGVRLPVQRDEGRLLVVAQTASDKRKSPRLVLDSAASGLILFGSNQGLDLEPDAATWVRVSTNAGDGMTQTGVLRALRLGGESFQHLPVAFVQDPAATENRAENGLLPTCLFRSVYFNNQEGYVVLNSQPLK